MKIKFKVFAKKTRRFIEPLYTQNELAASQEFATSADDYEFIPTTGLVDKNECEIFEGDQLLLGDDKFVVKWYRRRGQWFGQPAKENIRRTLLPATRFKQAEIY